MSLPAASEDNTLATDKLGCPDAQGDSLNGVVVPFNRAAHRWLVRLHIWGSQPEPKTVTVARVDHRYEVKSPYDPDFIEIIKKTVFWRGREWDKDGRRWLVDCLYIDVLRRELHSRGYVVTGNSSVRSLPPTAVNELGIGRGFAPDWSMMLFARIRNVDPGWVEPIYQALQEAWAEHPALATLADELRAGYEATRPR